MNEIIQIGLPIYFTLYFGIIFIYRSLIVWKRIGKNPLVLPKNDSAQGVIGYYFKIIFTSIFIFVILFSIFPNHTNFLMIDVLEFKSLKIVGVILLGISIIWTMIAQYQMKDSWRMGLDTETKTELVKSGLFSFSRNPIFLGLLLSLFGLFFIIPNTVTLIILLLGFVLIQIQTRLEEEFLINQFGEKYIEYQQTVRRFI